MDTNDLVNRFRHHPPKDEVTQQKHSFIRTSCLDLSEIINENVPDGREKSVAITKLEEVMMWANAGIARHNTE